MAETHLRQGRQTVKLGLIKAVAELFPGYQLKTSYSILEGLFCNLDNSVLSEREVRQIDTRLREWIAADSPIEYLYRRVGYYHYSLGSTVAKVIYPAHAETSLVEDFDILPFSYGFIVDFGDVGRGRGTALIPPRQLAVNYEKHQRWLDNIGIEFASDVNAIVASGRSTQLLGLAEALHEKEIADIADTILQERRSLRVLQISGPTSSGKTTFAQRICTQLEVNGLRPVPLSLDEYYRDPDHTPVDEDGEYDFEALEALDLELLRDHIGRLVGGEVVATPMFDFTTRSRRSATRPLQVGAHEVLVIEGIHALNPALLTGVNRAQTFKVYVSALAGIGIDLLNRIPTTEIRLIRRLVRDDRFRATHPEQTLDRWASVRRGEYQNVFSFQEEADVMFNTSILYELNALRPFAEECLSKIDDGGEHGETRDRLLNLLSFFEPMDISWVPHNSILREFVGGSIYS